MSRRSNGQALNKTLSKLAHEGKPIPDNLREQAAAYLGRETSGQTGSALTHTKRHHRQIRQYVNNEHDSGSSIKELG